jgi:hypothetical protein
MTTLEHVDALTVLRQLPPWMAMYSRVRTDDGPWTLAWFVREEPVGELIYSSEPVEVEFRGGLIYETVETRSVALVPIVVRVGPERYGNVFESWVDIHASGTLEALTTQKVIPVHLYDASGTIKRTLEADNPLRNFSRQVLAQLSSMSPWTVRDFFTARERIYFRYPKVWELWNALK